MAGGWVKSLQCKSRAFEDVYHPNPKVLIPSYSCRKTSQSLKDVIDTKPEKKPRKPKPKQAKPEPVPVLPTWGSDPFLTELPDGHASRNVVEIIFHTSWSPKAFSGRVEMIFKVKNGSRTVARFEEYRESVRMRYAKPPAREGSARCAADGNEMMRFYCLGPTGGGAWVLGGGLWGFLGGKGSGICTFSGSGEAHARSGAGRGRRAMLVCRVIAGRVAHRSELRLDSDGQVGFDSVKADGGELLVFDPRAVLPCFLVIYRL